MKLLKIEIRWVGKIEIRIIEIKNSWWEIVKIKPGEGGEEKKENWKKIKTRWRT